MVRKNSIKRKRMNRRTKSKRSFRKTKKLVCKSRSRSESRSQMKSLVGGGGACSTGRRCVAVSSPVLKFKSGNMWQYTWNDGKLSTQSYAVDGKIENEVMANNIESLRVHVVRNLKSIIDNMDSEDNIIAVFEQLRIVIIHQYFEFRRLTMSSLLYILNKPFDHTTMGFDIQYKLAWWLIEHGADVNYSALQPGSHKLNFFTILGNVIRLLTNLSSTKFMNIPNKLNVFNLTKFYNIVYTLVLLLSRGASMEFQIHNMNTEYDLKGPIVTTSPLQMLREKGVQWMTQMKELSGEIVSMSKSFVVDSDSQDAFDKESQAAFDEVMGLEAKTNSLIKIFIILKEPFDGVLDLISRPHSQQDETLLTALEQSCQRAMENVHRSPAYSVGSMGKSRLSELQLGQDSDRVQDPHREQDRDVTWFYVSDDSKKIKAYLPEIASFLEEAASREYTIFERLQGGVLYEFTPPGKPSVDWIFNFTAMTQTNPATTSTRSIQRGKVKWEWENDLGDSFEPFEPQVAQLLEKAYNQDEPIVNHTSTSTSIRWMFDLNTMTQTNIETNGKRKIKRTIVPVYS